MRTRDNVFSRMDVSIQFKIQSPEKAYYSLRDPTAQTSSHIENIVRSKAPKMTISELFEDKEELQKEVKTHLVELMKANGYSLIDILVTNIDPDIKVKDAMNKVLASNLLKEVAENEAEASRIKLVKEAEADKERKRLQGEGIAEQRSAILSGYREIVKGMATKLGISNNEAVSVALFSQYCDTLRDLASKSTTKTIFVPYSETNHANIFQNLRDGMMQAAESSDKSLCLSDTVNKNSSLQ